MSSVTESLFKWLKTFPLSSPNSLTDLCDGVHIAHVLHIISPSFFDEEWKSKIRSDVSPENWRLRVSNLKKIQERIVDFYSDVLNQPLTRSFTLPDPTAIGKDYKTSEIGRLLQLVIGCAVSCEKKEEHIQVIMGLEQEIQHGVMQAIQELMMPRDKDRDASMSMTFPDSLNIDQPFLLREQLRRLQEDLQAANDAKDATAQKCYELEKVLNALRLEKEALSQENERLALDVKNSVNEALNSKNVEDPSDESLRDRHFLKLQARIDGLQEDLIKTETLKDEYRVRIDLLEKELLESRLRSEELQRKAKEAKMLQDELDIHRHLLDKAEKNEQTIESYKKKLEELAEVKRKVKLLEDKSKEQMRRNMELEDDLSKMAALKVQMDVYKKQAQELQEQTVEQRHKNETLEFDYKRLEEKFDSVAQEYEKVSREKNQLKQELEEIRKRRPSSFTEESIAGLTKELCLNAEMMPADLKESIVRLESENVILREKIQENHETNEDMVQLRSKLQKLEEENQIANKRISALQSRLEDANALSASEAHVNRVQELQDAIKQIEILTVQLNEAEEKNAQLELLVTKKDEEMAEMATKYKKYVSRAKQVVKELEPISLQGPSSVAGSVPAGPFSAPPVPSMENPDDVNLLKTSLEEKDKLILQLQQEQRELNKLKALKEMEERLITVAFHNLASNLQRKSAADRIAARNASLSTTNSGSFLSRQRQATTRRYNSQTVSQSDFFE